MKLELEFNKLPIDLKLVVLNLNTNIYYEQIKIFETWFYNCYSKSTNKNYKFGLLCNLICKIYNDIQIINFVNQDYYKEFKQMILNSKIELKEVNEISKQ